MADLPNLFNHWDYFAQLSPEIIEELSQIAEICHSFQQETTLIFENQPNSNLFVLKHGVFRVEVDRSVVNTLEEPGETAGEMSWLTGNLPLASVIAEFDTHYLKIPFMELDRLDKKHSGLIRQHFYQKLPTIFSKRLINTNARARQVNILVEKLRSTEENLKLINLSLGYQITQTDADLTQLVNRLANQLLPKIKNCLEGDLNTDLALDLLQKMEVEIGAVTGLSKSGRKISHKIRSQITNRKIAEALDHLQETLGIPFNNNRSSEVNLLITDHWDTGSPKSIGAKEVMYIENKSLGDLDFYLSHSTNFNYIILSPKANKKDLLKTISISLNKVLFSNIWGLHKYLSWGSHISTLTVNRSSERMKINQQVTERLLSMGIRSSITAQIELVLEELLMNSLYDAPTDANGNHLFNHLSRSESVKLPGNDEVLVSFGSDGYQAGISVTDPYGSLTKETIFKYLKGGITGQFAQEANKGGAGKGLFLIYSNSDAIIFNIQPRHRTEVICLFNLEKKTTEEPFKQTRVEIYWLNN
ncbi:MAG: cyclic nucleotide-binding domain-containing protein [Bdellovibrionaceae bacterium]|nr:cyclic nucleotide-binding domain-containing protein [Pseudobdellovibrionaceae bacterium]MDW8189739.1 cyclic nucleotide-binding domain-containing protein [Pseudobdellovibrionaceae bacterium]